MTEIELFKHSRRFNKNNNLIQERQELIANMTLDEKALCGLQASQRENEIALYGKAETPYYSYKCEIYASTIGK